MGEETLILCQRCSSKKDMNQMKLDKAQNILLCAKCYYQVYAKGKEDRVLQAADVKRVHYSCMHCGYKFSRSESFVFGGLCFNCGRNMLQREDTKELLVRPAKTLLDY